MTNTTSIIRVFVDADACPVKDEVMRVPGRTYQASLEPVVSNSWWCGVHLAVRLQKLVLNGDISGGPPALDRIDRWRFLQALEQAVQNVLRNR